MANNLSGNSTEIRMGITTRWTNAVLPRMGLADRKALAQEIRTLSHLAPFDPRNILINNGILKPGFNGQLSEVQPENIRRFSTETKFDSALGALGITLSQNYDPATQQLPDGLAGLSNRTRMLIGFQFTKQASEKHMEEGQQLVAKLNDSDGVLTADIRDSMTAIIEGIESSLDSIPSPEVRDQLTGIIKTIKEKHKKVQTTPLDENDRAEIREVLSNIDGVVGEFRFQHEPHAPHLSLKVGSALSRFLTLGFMASILYLGTNTGYTNVDRAFYFTATASLALYAWGAANFTKIMSESESIRNLEFTQDSIAFRNLPREATKRFSNLGYKDGIASLIQDFYLDVVFGNHDLVLNNDSSNSYYQSTYGDSKEIWRIEKRAAIFERELRAANLQKNGQPLDDASYRRLAAIMAMGERDIPSHFLLLEAAQRSGVHLGKVTCLLYKAGERGAEYASFNAARQIIADLAKTDPKIKTLVEDNRYLPSILDRMGAGFFLSGKFDKTLLEMATAAGISPQTRLSLQKALEKDKVNLYRESLVQAAKDSGIDENRSQLFAATYLSMLTTAEDMKTIAEETRGATYRSADADEEKLAGSISREFGIDLEDAKHAVEAIKPTNTRDIESEARNLNRDIAIPIGIRARMRDLVKAILFNERTDSERGHEEGNFHETAKALPNGSYLKDLIDSARQDFMAKDNGGNARKGTMKERIFLSLKTRGIGDYTAKIIVNKVMNFAAAEYAKRFLSEEYERRVNASGHSRWWEVDHAMFKDYLGAIEDKIRETTADHQALEIEDIGPEKTTRVIAVISELISLHQGIVNRTTDGYLATIAEDAIGISQVTAAFASALPAIERKAKEVKDDLNNKKKELARALYGDANPEALKKAEPVVKAIDGLIRKGMGIERAQARFQDGNFLSFESLAAQIPDILFGDDKLHRTMLNKDSRYEAGTMQEDEMLESIVSGFTTAEEIPTIKAITEKLIAFCESHKGKYSFDVNKWKLTIKGEMTGEEREELQAVFSNYQHKEAIKKSIVKASSEIRKAPIGSINKSKIPEEHLNDNEVCDLFVDPNADNLVFKSNIKALTIELLDLPDDLKRILLDHLEFSMDLGFFAKNKDKYSFDVKTGKFVVKGKMSEEEKKELSSAFSSQEDSSAIERLYHRSQTILRGAVSKTEIPEAHFKAVQSLFVDPGAPMLEIKPEKTKKNIEKFDIPEDLKVLLINALRPSNIREAIGNYVMAMSARFQVLEDIQDKLRQESRRLDPHDLRLKKIDELKGKIKAKEEEIEKTTDPAEKEQLEDEIEKLLREKLSRESQIHHRRERVKETTVAPFADVVLEEMERDGAAEPLAVRVEARRADIIMRMIERESKSYGLGAKPKENKPILDALKKLVEETIAINPRIPEDAPNTPVWRTFLYFERMNRDKYKGSKGANNDSSLGFYLGERIGVRLYTMLESMTSEESRVPPEILADIFRNFCDKVRLHPDFTEDQRIKEENGLFPEMIAKDLVRLIYEEKMSSVQAVATLAHKWEDAVLDINEDQIEPLFAVASEIAVRAYGHEVLGYVAAKAEILKRQKSNKPPIDRNSLPDNAQRYYDLAVKYADVAALLKSKSYSNLSDDERAALKKEAALLQKRLTANEKIMAGIEAWFQRRSKIISKQEPNEDIRKKKIAALREGAFMRQDRYALFHPFMSWYLVPAIDQPFAPGDRFKQFVGEGWQKRRREFIIPGRMTAHETAARMMTTSNNRMPMKKLENGFLRPYGLAFLAQARAIDENIQSEYPDGIYGRDLEEVTRKISKMKDKERNYIAPHLDTDRFERPVEDERDVVRDLDADNFVFESSQAKANAYWQKRDGRALRSYSALLQTQQAYPEMYSRLSSTQNYMGVLYSTTLGKSYGKRGKQVIMGCYIVKNRRAFAEATDWVEIPVLKRPEVEFVEESFSKDKTGDNPINRQIKSYRYLKLLSKYAAAATLAGVGGALAFSGGGLMAVAAIGLTAGLTKFLLSENFENRFWRLVGYGMLAGSGALLATAIASGLWVAGLPLLAGVGVGLAARVLDLWYHKSDSKAQRLFGKAIIPVAIGVSLFINPIIAAGVFFGLYHFDDIKHLPYRFNIDSRQRVADRLGITRESVIGRWWLMRQKLVRMYEEEEIYSQPDDVEDFGSSPAVFQRGYHSDFHQSIDGVSDDVKDKSTLDGQRGRWHGGMVGNLLRAIQAFSWDRQAMPDLDWMRYTLQTLGPAGSFSRFLLNINLWSFLGLGVTAFAFGTSPEALRNLLIGCSVISFLNYMTFASLLRRAMMTYGATWQKVSDMMAVLDSFSPVNLAQGITRVFYGETPPFLLTRSPTEPVSTATGNILAQTLPIPPFVNKTGKWEENIRKTLFSGEPLINTVVQTLRVRMGYALGAGAILLYTMPNLPYIGSGEILYSVMKGSLLFWSMLPILITTRSLSVIKEGASPYGTYKKIDKDAKGEPGKVVEKRRVKQLKKGLGKSAFNPINKISSSILMAGTNPVLIAGAMAIAAGAGLHYLSEEHTSENYSAASTQTAGDNLVIIPKIIPSATISSAASASSLPVSSAEPLTPSVSTLPKALQVRYETWKPSFMKNLDDGSTIIIDKSQNKSVSEGTGYGAMIAEKLADRGSFDRIQKGYDNLTKNRPDGLSSWEMDMAGNITKTDNAIDADIDNAAALLDAHKRWNDQTYLDKAQRIASATATNALKSVNGKTYLMPSSAADNFVKGSDLIVNPSYFDIEAFREFAKIDPAHANEWNAVVSSSYEVMEKCIEKWGFVPDWVGINSRGEVFELTSEYRRSNNLFAETQRVHVMGNDAIRVLWNLAIDYKISHNERAGKIMKAILDKNPSPYNTKVADSNSQDGWHNEIAAAAFALAAKVTNHPNAAGYIAEFENYKRQGYYGSADDRGAKNRYFNQTIVYLMDLEMPQK